MTDTALDKMYVEPQERVLDPSLADQSLIDRMPSPTGWRLLILPYRGKGKTEGQRVILHYRRIRADFRDSDFYFLKPCSRLREMPTFKKWQKIISLVTACLRGF